MTDLKAAAQQALEALEDTLSGDLTPYQAAKTSAALRAALAEHYCDTHCTWLDHAQKCVRAEPVQEPYTGDVTRIIREAGMTFHLGLPHKPVIEQMSRVVDLVYAEASIKAAQQFAAPPQRKPLTDEQWQIIADVLDCFITGGQQDAIEAALGIGSKT